MRKPPAVLAAAIALAGCPKPVPTRQAHAIRLVIVGDETRPIYVEAARAWRELGLDVGYEDPGMPECPQRWPSVARCQITIGIVRAAGVRQEEGSDAAANRRERRIRIDTTVTDPLKLRARVAHEVGHIVLDTPRHTVGGVMGGADWVLHDVDRQLACETIKICR